MTVRGPQLHLRRLSCWSALCDAAHLVSVLSPVVKVKSVRRVTERELASVLVYAR